MKIILSPSELCGTITVQPSKSDAHRKLICAVFAKGTSVISNVILSEDIKATLRCAEASGAEYFVNDDAEENGRYSITIKGTGGKRGGIRQVDCGESGSTVRFMTMIFAAAGGETVLSGSGRLPVRPMDSAVNFLRKSGLYCSHPEHKIYLPLSIKGELTAGDYKIDASVTSQYISGLMMALPSFAKNGKLTAEGRFESRGYVEVTKQVLEQFGVRVSGNNPYIIPKNSGLTACSAEVEGDWSNASYFYVMKALGMDIKLDGISNDSRQPDSVINEYISIILKDENPVINVSECPDIMPSLAVLGAALKKKTTITGGERLRAKESDRIRSVAEGLTALGVNVKELKDGMEIIGNGRITGGVIDSCNDHRIAMAFSALCVVAEGDIVIIGAESVAKSYPAFFEDLRKLGGNINE